MRVDQVMSRSPVTVDPDEKVVEAARSMRTRHVSSVLVVRDGRLVGIVTERDFAFKLVAEAAPIDAMTIGEIMTPDPATITPGASVWEAMSRMTVTGVRHLPVTENGRPVGIVSMRDLVSVTDSHVARVQAMLASLDEVSRERIASLLLWAVDQRRIQPEEYPLIPGVLE